MNNISLKDKVNISFLNIRNIRYDLIQQVILWQKLIKRKSIAKTKTVSEVSGSTRKIYRQKGTGKARHGSIKSSCFIGGGIAFGPKLKQNYASKINAKIIDTAFKHSIALQYKSNRIFLYKNDFFNVRSEISLYKSTKKECKFNILVIYLAKQYINYKNNKNIKYIKFENINIIDIIKYKNIFISSDILKKILNKLK